MENVIDKLLKYLVVIVIICIVISCDRDKKKPAYEYFPDMASGDAYKNYEANSIFPDRKNMQVPVDGTIPRNLTPYKYPKTRDGMKLAGIELYNPLQITEGTLNQGKKEYNIFCSNCHGLTGDGNGNLYSSGKYPSEPTALNTEDITTRPDGELYHVITVGSAIMGPFGSMIRPKDRWSIVTYIKTSFSSDDINN